MEANYPNFNSAVEAANGLHEIRELQETSGMSETEAAALVAVKNTQMAKMANHPRQMPADLAKYDPNRPQGDLSQQNAATLSAAVSEETIASNQSVQAIPASAVRRGPKT